MRFLGGGFSYHLNQDVRHGDSFGWIPSLHTVEVQSVQCGACLKDGKCRR